MKEYYVSIRVVSASNYGEATRKVEEEIFEESHPLCDKILPLDTIKILHPL